MPAYSHVPTAERGGAGPAAHPVTSSIAALSADLLNERVFGKTAKVKPAPHVSRPRSRSRRGEVFGAGHCGALPTGAVQERYKPHRSTVATEDKRCWMSFLLRHSVGPPPLIEDCRGAVHQQLRTQHGRTLEPGVIGHRQVDGMAIRSGTLCVLYDTRRTRQP